MKKILLFIFTAALLFQSCNDGNEVAPDLALSKVQFTMSAVTIGNAGGRVQSKIPKNSTAIVTLTSASNIPVLTRHRIKLITLQDEILTEPLELAPGNYRVSEFMIVNDSSEVLYATPSYNSPLASAVDKPLPINFSVSTNEVSTVNIEVVSVNEYEAKDFGFATFNIEVVTPYPVYVSVFIRDSTTGNLILTDADASLSGETDYYTLFEAKPNLIYLQDPNRNYFLFVQTKNYDEDVPRSTMHKYFSGKLNYNELIRNTGSNHLKIILEEARVVTIYGGEFQNVSFDVTLKESGTITIDWQDGSQPLSYNFNAGETKTVSYDYSEVMNGYHSIYITGDVHKVSYVSEPH